VHWRGMSLGCFAVVSGSAVFLRPERPPDGDFAHLQEILTNDNRTRAGELRGNVLSINLIAAPGIWFPEDDKGPGHRVYAFGEEGRTLSNPGPLLRVPAGTEIRVTIRNGIPDSPLVVHGLHDRPGVPAVMTVPAAGTGSVRFRVTSPGTYFYWATTRGARTLRDRFGMESQLMGALIVDPPGAAPADHVFVIGIEDDSTAGTAARHLRAAVVNGRSWPHSQTNTVRAGDTVRMRWINASDRLHPMHLHGFYFTVDSHGDMAQDTAYPATRKRLAVTELMLQGQTMSLSWIPDRPGNWLMHCHMAAHMSPDLRGGPRRASDGLHPHNHALDAMAGLVTGWRVLPSAPATQANDAGAALTTRRKLRLLVQSAPSRYEDKPGLGFVLQAGDVAPRQDSVVIPGPAIVLTRGEPVQITVVNRLSEATSVHWHGIELDSYFDGVSGWSGAEGRTAPPVEPRDSFVVRFTPPRAGTFIYHSHFDEERQLASGLYGPLIVLEPGARYDRYADRPWVLSQAGPAEGVNRPVMLNGSTTPVVELYAKRRYRIRLININPNLPLTFSVLADSVPVSWRAVAKDGADLPAAQSQIQPAQLRIGVGEAYDFEFAPGLPRDLRLLAVDPAGRVRLSGLIRVRGEFGHTRCFTTEIGEKAWKALKQAV